MKNNIDNLLKQWDKNSAPKFRDPEEMAEHIKNTVKSAPEFQLEPHLKIVHKGWIYSAAAAIIILTATVATLMIEIKEKSADRVFGGINRAELAQLKKINKELQLLFPDSLKSFCIVNGSITINTQDEKNISELKNIKKRLLVRYSVMEKKNGRWVTTVQNDVVTSVGKNQLLANNGMTPKGYIWSWPADKNVIALESDLEIIVGNKTYPVKFFGGQKLNSPKMLKENNNIRIYQTINLI